MLRGGCRAEGSIRKFFLGLGARSQWSRGFCDLHPAIVSVPEDGRGFVRGASNHHAGRTQDQAAFAKHLKELLAQEEYRVTGIYDDGRFERYVRANLRKLAKMTKANVGFANTLRYQC